MNVDAQQLGHAATHDPVSTSTSARSVCHDDDQVEAKKYPLGGDLVSLLFVRSNQEARSLCFFVSYLRSSWFTRTSAGASGSRSSSRSLTIPTAQASQAPTSAELVKPKVCNPDYPDAGADETPPRTPEVQGTGNREQGTGGRPPDDEELLPPLARSPFPVPCSLLFRTGRSWFKRWAFDSPSPSTFAFTVARLSAQRARDKRSAGLRRARRR